jgi:hypothetical protein
MKNVVFSFPQSLFCEFLLSPLAVLEACTEAIIYSQGDCGQVAATPVEEAF